MVINRRLSYLVDRIQTIPLWVYPLLVTILFFMPVKHVYFNADGVEYMGQALNVYHGLGLVDLDQVTPLPSRVFFPVYMSLAFSSFGPSEITVFFFIRIFYVLDVLLIYFLAQKLFSQVVGLLASFLLLTSFSINEWGTIINLDYMLPFFMLASMLLLYLGFEKTQTRWFVLAGIMLSLGFLLKETAIVLFTLPGVLWLFIGAYRTRSRFFGLIATMLITALIAGTWVLYARSIVSQPDLSFGNQGQVVLRTTKITLDNTYLAQTVSKVLEALVTYYQTQLEPNFFFAPLFILAWVSTLFSALWGKDRHGSRVLFLCLLPFFPQMIYQGVYGFRATQGVIIFFLCYIALAQFLWTLIGLMQKLWNSLWFTKRLSPVAWLCVRFGLILAVMLIQAGERQLEFEGRPLLELYRVGRGNMLDHVRRFNTLAYLGQLDKTWITQLEWGAGVGQWLRKYVPRGTVLMASSRPVARVLYWTTQGNYPFYTIPWTSSWSSTNLSAEQAIVPWQHILFLQSVGNWQQILDTDLELRSWIALTEDQLLAEIRARSAEYVAVGQNSFELAYFMQSPKFVLVANFNTVQIFQVVSTKSTSDLFETHLVDNTLKDLQDLYRLYPNKYQQLEANFLYGTLGLTEMERAELLAGKFPTIINRHSLDTYFQDFQTQKPEWLHEVIAVQQQKARLNPKNPWPFITLGHLYEALKEYPMAFDAYRQAVAINPDDSQLRLYLAKAYLAEGQRAEEREAFDEAIEAYRQAFTLASTDPGVRRALIQAYVALGDSYFDSTLLTEVITAYQRTIDLEPDNLQGYWQLAEAYQSINQLDEAMTIYASVIERWPESADTHFRLGQAYELQEDTATAIAEYKRAIELETTLVGAHLRLGYLYQTQGQVKEALTLYQTAVEQNPEVAWPHLELGKIYLDQANLQ